MSLQKLPHHWLEIFRRYVVLIVRLCYQLKQPSCGVCIEEISPPELQEMWLSDLACFTGVNSIEEHSFEELRKTAYLSSDLFKFIFLQFNFLSKYFVDGFICLFDLFWIFLLPLWEIESRYLWLLLLFLHLTQSLLLLRRDQGLLNNLSHRSGISLRELLHKLILRVGTPIRWWIYDLMLLTTVKKKRLWVIKLLSRPEQPKSIDPVVSRRSGWRLLWLRRWHLVTLNFRGYEYGRWRRCNNGPWLRSPYLSYKLVDQWLCRGCRYPLLEQRVNLSLSKLESDIRIVRGIHDIHFIILT